MFCQTDGHLYKREIKKLLKICNAVAATMSQKYVSRDEMAMNCLEHEILLAQNKTENPEKPDNIIMNDYRTFKQRIGKFV